MKYMFVLLFASLALGQNEKTDAAQGPFGFRKGMTREAVTALLGKAAILESKGDRLVLNNALKPNDKFEYWALFFLLPTVW